MAENTTPAMCSEAVYEAARAAGLLIVTTGEEVAIQKFADAIQTAAYAEGRKDEREEQETFLRDLLWGEVQVCCGNYHAGYGGEYMGQVEMVPVCCGCPDVERSDGAQILAVLRARVPDPTICQTCHADPIPGHKFCPDCKDEWPA